MRSERGKGRGLSRLEAEPVALALASAHGEVHGVGRVPRVPFECRLWFRLLLLLPFELLAGLLGLLGRCGEAHGPLPLLLGLLLGLPDGTGRADERAEAERRREENLKAVAEERARRGGSMLMHAMESCPMRS